MMKEIFEQKQLLKKEFDIKQRFDAFTGAVIYAILIMLPVFFMLIEASIVYMYILTLWVILIIIALILFVFLQQVFWRKSLLLKKPDMKTNTKIMLIFNLITSSVFLAICGLIFTLVLVPILWK